MHPANGFLIFGVPAADASRIYSVSSILFTLVLIDILHEKGYTIYGWTINDKKLYYLRFFSNLLSTLTPLMLNSYKIILNNLTLVDYEYDVF